MSLESRPFLLAAVCVFAAATATIVAQRSTSPPAGASAGQTVTNIAAAAQALMSTLDDPGRAKVQFPFDAAHKSRWSNFPTGIFQRQGLRMGDLTPTQRGAVMHLLAVALSANGYKKVTEIMGADEALRKSEGGRAGGGGGGRGGGRGGPAFGQDEYYVAFVGAPSTTAPWMLQFGGHHLGINLTLAGSEATLAPSHTGTQPASYALEAQTIRPLGRESDQAFALVNALDSGQRGQAILNYRISDLVLGPGQDGRTIQPEGIRASALSAAQQTMLLDIAREWTGIMNDAFAEPRLAEIRANLPQTYFAWSGPTTAGSVAYFRIQGPTLVIEYAPQNGVDHIHTIYRDPTNDYGAKFIGKQ